MRVAYTMGESGFADHLKPLLARVGKEKEPKPRSSMARAIAKLGPEDPKVQKALVKALSSSDDLVREQACVALAPFAKEKAVKSALKKVMLQGGSQDTRMAAVWALGYCEDEKVADELKSYKESLGRWDWKLKPRLSKRRSILPLYAVSAPLTWEAHTQQTHLQRRSLMVSLREFQNIKHLDLKNARS